MAILNLTQHPASDSQLEAGVVEPTPSAKDTIKRLLTFDAPPEQGEMAERAARLTAIAVASGCSAVMVGGAPFFMSTLERILLEHGVAVVYSFTKRRSVEETNEAGETIKRSVFSHEGFTPASTVSAGSCEEPVFLRTTKEDGHWVVRGGSPGGVFDASPRMPTGIESVVEVRPIEASGHEAHDARYVKVWKEDGNSVALPAEAYDYRKVVLTGEDLLA